MPVTVLLRIDPASPGDAALAKAADLVRRGGVVVFPTETVYGIGASAFDIDAVERIFRIKGRPANNPLIVHLGDESDLPRAVGDWPETASTLARTFWPGPLTLVVPKHANIPSIVTGSGPTVAVRIPSHPVARRLIQLAGVPIAAPSANRSGELSPTTAEHAWEGLTGQVDLILDAGPAAVGLESTVLDLTTKPPRLLRPGHITRTQLEKIIGPIAWSEVTVKGDSPLP
jgi:L-threonylcarbamoyladenylate synthase